MSRWFKIRKFPKFFLFWFYYIHYSIVICNFWLFFSIFLLFSKKSIFWMRPFFTSCFLEWMFFFFKCLVEAFLEKKFPEKRWIKNSEWINEPDLNLPSWFENARMLLGDKSSKWCQNHRDRSIHIEWAHPRHARDFQINISIR